MQGNQVPTRVDLALMTVILVTDVIHPWGRIGPRSQDLGSFPIRNAWLMALLHLFPMASASLIHLTSWLLVNTISTNQTHTSVFRATLLLPIRTYRGNALVQKWLVISSTLDCLSCCDACASRGIYTHAAATVGLVVVMLLIVVVLIAASMLFLLLLDFEEHLDLLFGEERWLFDLGWLDLGQTFH